MPSTPTTRKRAVPAARPKATAASAAPAVPAVPAAPAAPRKVPARKPAARRVPPTLLDEEPPATNYALRLTEESTALVPEVEQEEGSTFELRLSEALKAINAAQGLTPPESERVTVERRKTGLATWLAALEKLPPIRLPIGPAIPWRIGLPLMVVLVISMGLASRLASSSGESTGVRLPSPQPTVVATSTPVNLTSGTAAAAIPATSADLPPTVAPESVPTLAPETAPTAAPQTAPTVAPQPIGVQEPAGGFDLADIAIKLVAVLALIYGSLMLLKRFGFGGVGGVRTSSSSPGVRVVASIALAPNRSVHVIKAPGGKTLLVGSTPNSVNLLTELDETDPD
jgi:flagellar biosynthetic protein FliO